MKDLYPMAVYLFGKLKVKNWDWYAEYKVVVEALVEKHSGKYLVKGGKIEQLEGSEAPPGAVVLVEFPSMEHVHQFYQDPEYRPMIELRKVSGVDTTLLVVEGFSG